MDVSVQRREIEGSEDLEASGVADMETEGRAPVCGREERDGGGVHRETEALTVVESY